jgi:hypothetical protein
MTPTQLELNFDPPTSEEKEAWRHLESRGDTFPLVHDKAVQAAAVFIRDMSKHELSIYTIRKAYEQGPRAGIFKIGNRPDKAKPKGRIPVVRAERKGYRVMRPYTEAEQAQIDHCIALAKVVVPKRSGKKQREVNWQYLNWISGGVYG